MKKWIWESPQYPNFKYQEQSFRDLLDNIEYNQNRLEILVKNETDKALLNQKIDILTDEIADTSFIEGEILQRISVRDSIKKRLDDNFDEFGKNYSTKQTDNLASLLLDTNLNKSPLTIQRLHGWHNCLFEGGYNGLYKINIARFRKEEIEVVSGKIGKTKTYYQAIPFDRLEDSMEEFLHYCNHSTQNSYIKSALAHLWFVIIHPYDDGNGRIARAIADYLLPNKDIKLYSLSNQIKEHRKEYYEVLEKTTSYNDECDISNWLQWHLKITNLAIKKGINTLENIVKKTKFWDFCEETLPTLLQKDIEALKACYRGESKYDEDCLWCELYSTINIFQHGGGITKEVADYLRSKYLGMGSDDEYFFKDYVK